MKKIVLILLMLFVICGHISAQLRTEYKKNNDKIRIYLANSVVGRGVDTTLLNANKIKIALHTLTLLNNKYELVSDNLVNEAINRLNNPTAIHIGQELLADRIFIIKLEQLVNVIRIEIISANSQFPDTVNTGEGIAVLKLFKKSDGMPYFDPTILTAMQRAFASVENDSLMFMAQDEPYNVKPAPSIVIAGIEFINDNNFMKWEVFNNPLINSFEYSEAIFEEIYKAKNWIVYDIESRDALYGLFNLFLIENNVAPSYNELAALRRFNIEYYISGKIERNRNGVKITLMINDNRPTSNEVVKSVSKEVYESNNTKIRTTIKELARELIEK